MFAQFSRPVILMLQDAADELTTVNVCIPVPFQDKLSDEEEGQHVSSSKPLPYVKSSLSSGRSERGSCRVRRCHTRSYRLTEEQRTMNLYGSRRY